MSRLLARRISSNLARLSTRAFSLSGAPIDISPEVKDALNTGRPVVALETAIVTHGLPYPINLETALEVEGQVRAGGAVPATIGVVDGRIAVGLEKAQLEMLADPNVVGKVKMSRRDLAVAVGLKKSGGTTIAGTSVIAATAGIPIFSTGGLGGVHRGGEVSWDVSADLTELGRTPIAVISAGVKSILDIGRTLEYLETQGVAVLTYGPTKHFPGFYSPNSGHQTLWNVNSPLDAARIIDANRRLGLQSGMLFAAPIPDQYASVSEEIQRAVDQAVRESEENGMSKKGKDATPWLLARVTELTEGKTLPNNIALIKNTAFIGGKIAAEYANLARKDKDDVSGVFVTDGEYKKEPSAPEFKPVDPPCPDILIVGSAAVDVISQPVPPSNSSSSLPMHTTNRGKVKFSMGGVARNMAEAAHRVISGTDVQALHRVMLVSPIGNDLPGSLISAATSKLGMRIDGLLTSFSEKASAVCNMHLEPDGNLLTGVADMGIVEELEADLVLRLIQDHNPKLVAFDGNLNTKSISDIVGLCSQRSIPTFFEPTSVPKSLRIIPALNQFLSLGHRIPATVTFLSPNQLELSTLYQEIRASEELTSTHWWSVMDDLSLGEAYRSDLALLSKPQATGGNPFLSDGLPQMAVTLLPFFQHLFIKCGSDGVFVVMRVTDEGSITAWSKERTRAQKRQIVAKGKESTLVLKHYPALALRQNIVNVTGAGDSLVGSLLADISQRNTPLSPEGLDEVVERAQRAAVLSLYSHEAVSPLLTSDGNSVPGLL